jgi:hypothetical protein
MKKKGHRLEYNTTYTPYHETKDTYGFHESMMEDINVRQCLILT